MTAMHKSITSNGRDNVKFNVALVTLEELATYLKKLENKLEKYRNNFDNKTLTAIELDEYDETLDNYIELIERYDRMASSHTAG